MAPTSAAKHRKHQKYQELQATKLVTVEAAGEEDEHQEKTSKKEVGAWMDCFCLFVFMLTKFTLAYKIERKKHKLFFNPLVRKVV